MFASWTLTKTKTKTRSGPLASRARADRLVAEIASGTMETPPDGSAGSDDESPERPFEDSYEVAERAALRLERGDLTLDESLAQYQEGALALRDCYRALQGAERRLEVLRTELGRAETQSDSGVPRWESASPEGPLAEVLTRLIDDERQQDAEEDQGD